MRIPLKAVKLKLLEMVTQKYRIPIVQVLDGLSIVFAHAYLMRENLVAAIERMEYLACHMDGVQVMQHADLESKWVVGVSIAAPEKLSPELYCTSILPYLKNALVFLDELVYWPPGAECVDYEQLTAMSDLFGERIRDIEICLHPVKHMDPLDEQLQSLMQNILSSFVCLSECDQVILQVRDTHKVILQHIEALKHPWMEELEDFLQQLEIHGSLEKVKSELDDIEDELKKYLKIKKEFEHWSKDNSMKQWKAIKLNTVKTQYLFERQLELIKKTAIKLQAKKNLLAEHKLLESQDIAILINSNSWAEIPETPELREAFLKLQAIFQDESRRNSLQLNKKTNMLVDELLLLMEEAPIDSWQELQTDVQTLRTIENSSKEMLHKCSVFEEIIKEYQSKYEWCQKANSQYKNLFATYEKINEGFARIGDIISNFCAEEFHEDVFVQ